MRKIFLFVAIAALSNISLVKAQDADATAANDNSQYERDIAAPDYSSIDQLVSDPNSLFYYPHLFKRYMNNDTTLTLREYRMLYYGFFFQDGYSVSALLRTDDSLNTLLKKDNPTTSDLEKIARMEKNDLQFSPFELKKLNILFLVNKRLGNTLAAKQYLDKVRKIAYTILSSGDGQTENTGMHVLQISDEYAIVNILGYEYSGAQKLTDTQCDYLALKDNGDNIKGLYFDVKQILKGYKKLYGDK